MKSFSNIEKSKSAGRQYVGYAGGHSWRIAGCHGNWSAYRNGTVQGSINSLIMYDTLSEISEELAKIDQESNLK